MDNESSGASVNPSLKRNSNDVGWDYGKLVDPNVMERVQCILCGKIMFGGIHRLKEHVAHISGNVAKCPKAKSEDTNKCRNALMESKNKKRNKMMEEKLKRGEVNIDGSEEIEDVEVGGVRKESHHLGPIDKFTRPINPDLSSSSKKSMRQQNINEALFKERLEHVHTWVTTWMFNRAVPWHVVVNDDFMRACEAIGQFGRGYRPPNYYEIGEQYLPNKVEETKLLLKRQEEEWAKNGCSIMTDAWTDRKRRSIMNLCVNCRLGTAFLSSKECSDVAHTAEHIFEYVNGCIEQVGPANVVQIVTDNASNNMAAAKILKEKRPNIFWTSCAAHTVNLMLESIGKLPRFGKYIEQAKQLTIFIYAHHRTLGMMRSFTKKKDIVRPGKTRFASAFLTLQSLMDKKNALKTMFGSEEWEKCNYSKSKKGKLAYETVMSLAFWNGVTCCLKVFAPLIKVLRLVDGDRKPSMPWLYGELRKAKQDIREALSNLENNYRPIIEKIDEKMKDRLDSPLHKTAFLLNPYYHFKDSSISDESELLSGFMECVEIFHHGDIASQDVIIMTEWPLYQMKQGSFGRPLAIKGCDSDSKDPVTWWSMFGSHTPNLLNLAKRILSLTTSSSGCERNWSSFEWIHSKKRNRLNTDRLNNLVFVNFNSQLSNKMNKQVENEKNVDVLLSANADAADAQGWLVRGGDEDDEVSVGLEQPRQLDEDDFDSGEEENEEEGRGGEKNIDVEFESDNEQVMEDVYRDDEDWLRYPPRP